MLILEVQHGVRWSSKATVDIIDNHVRFDQSDTTKVTSYLSSVAVIPEEKNLDIHGAMVFIQQHKTTEFIYLFLNFAVKHTDM